MVSARPPTRGVRNAQFRLGVMYDEGQGVTRDATEAVTWYRKAAEQGHADARLRLGGRPVVEMTDTEYNSHFKCPESYEDRGARRAGLRQFFERISVQHPNWTVQRAVEYRVELLERHRCEQTLANIRSNQTRRALSAEESREQPRSPEAGHSASRPGPATPPAQEPPPSSDARPAATVLRPTDTHFEISRGRFGPCELERDPETRVAILYCDKSGDPRSEGILFNFYLPGIWASKPFTAEQVAMRIRDGVKQPTTVNFAFGAPHPVSHAIVYYITLMTVYADRNAGQVSFMKVAPLGDAVYSMSYSRMFSGPPEQMPEMIRKWLLSNLKRSYDAIDEVEPDEQWVSYLRKAPWPEPPPPKADVRRGASLSEGGARARLLEAFPGADLALCLSIRTDGEGYSRFPCGRVRPPARTKRVRGSVRNS